MIWVHSVGQVPLAFLMMVAAFKSMDPSLEESAMMSGANTGQTLRRVTLRLLMPTTASVLLILFVRTLESFETPALIGIPARIYVYTSEIYLAFNEYPPDYGRGAALAVGLLLLSARRRLAVHEIDAGEQKISNRHGQSLQAAAVRSRAVEVGRLQLSDGVFRFRRPAAVPRPILGVLPALLCRSRAGMPSRN